MIRTAPSVFRLDAGRYLVRVMAGWKVTSDGRRIRNRVARIFDTEDEALGTSSPCS